MKRQNRMVREREGGGEKGKMTARKRR